LLALAKTYILRFILLNNHGSWFPSDKVAGFGADSFLAEFVVWVLVALEATGFLFGGAGIAAGYHGDTSMQGI